MVAVPNEQFMDMMASIENDWPILIGEEVYSSFKNMIPGDSLNNSKKKDIFLNMYLPEEILNDNIKRKILFERLSPASARDLAKAIEFQSDDLSEIYSKINSIKFNGIIKEKIFAHFGIEPAEKNEPANMKPIDDAIPNYGLHNYQLSVKKKAKSELEKESSRCLIHMPTGSGKTRTTMDLLCEMMNKDKMMILWLAYSVELCEQASEDFKKAWENRGNRPVKIFNLFGDSKGLSFPSEKVDGIVISTLGKLININKSDRTFLPQNSKNISILVFDEAHQAIAPEYKHLIKQITVNNSKCKFLSLIHI